MSEKQVHNSPKVALYPAVPVFLLSIEIPTHGISSSGIYLGHLSHADVNCRSGHVLLTLLSLLPLALLLPSLPLALLAGLGLVWSGGRGSRFRQRDKNLFLYYVAVSCRNRILLYFNGPFRKLSCAMLVMSFGGQCR